ncbi:hypothetical protein ACQEXU_08155 [Vibrio sp. TRT 21S02]|uniref:hypothetical protein n=1 Tax=Vibrio sp. TRT 21S02 TaxID=3418507 RepID=UPI003CECAC53
MNKFLVMMNLALFMLPLNVAASSCKVEGYTIGFFNGVATTSESADLGLLEIESTLDISKYKDEPVEYQLFYNDSYIEGSVFNVLADFAETFDQRTEELEQKQFKSWEAFWELVNGRSDSSIIQKIDSLFIDFAEVVLDFGSKIMNKIVAKFLNQLAQYVDSPDSVLTEMQQYLISDSLTWKGKKLIYIAHSQGNLWANKAYRQAVSQPGYSEDNVHVVHIAPASATLSPNSDYVLSSSDFVIQLVRQLTGPFSVPMPNVLLVPGTGELLGHGLSEVYLSHDSTVDLIKKAVKRGFSRVAKPEMEDFLFKVEFDYSSSYDQIHEEPAYDVIDAGNGVFGWISEYLDDTDTWPKMTLTPLVSTEKKLPFNVKVPDLVEEPDSKLFKKTIVFDACASPAELKKVEQTIPPYEFFLFAQWFNLKDFKEGTFLNTWRSSIVTDRYGRVERNRERYEDTNDWYFECAGDGESMEFEVSQRHYDELQLTYLTEQQLSGRYEIAASDFESLCHPH